MNILIATYLVPTSPSGVVTFYRELTGDLLATGVSVQTVDSTSTPLAWSKFLGGLKRIMRSLGNRSSVIYDEFAYFTGVFLATRRLRRTNVDVIHAQDVRSGVAAYLALGRRVPVVLTCHFNDDPVRELVLQFNLKSGFTRWLTAWYVYLFKYVHHYVFTSEYTYTQVKHLLPTDIHKRIIRNAVRLMASDQPARPTDIAPDRLIISNVGYIDERKNQQLLVQIGHELVKRGIGNFQLWFIGDGPKRADYTALAQELGLTDHVRFFGQQTAPWRLVAQSDLYVHTALNDNCPYSIIEAFAVGTPVLALPVGGIPEMLPEGIGALRGKTVAELTDEVAQYFDPKIRRRVTDAQTDYAALVFNRQANLEKLLSFYQQITGKPVPVVAQSDYAL